MKRNYFGTDGVRGPYGGPVLTDTFAWRLGWAVGRYFNEESNHADSRVYLGRDTRESGVPLLKAAAGGLAAAGLTPFDLGVVPTPAVALATLRMGARLGVMITASHNPSTDNGIKIFHGTGLKLTDAEEAAIETLLEQAPDPGPEIAVSGVDFLPTYRSIVQDLLPPDALAGWRIALDTANGATVGTSPVVLRALGAELVQLGDHPDGKNINAGVGSEHPEALAEQVRSHSARIGIAHDGDGDRCVLCDETGTSLDGDEILTILACHALKQGLLPTNALVVTVQSNLGLDEAVRAAGGEVYRTQVGDRYVMEEMRRIGARLGGESSGHVICADIAPTGDGLIAALRVLEVMRDTGRPLSELRQALRRYPQASASIRVAEKIPLEERPRLRQAIAEIEQEFGKQGRVLVRYSGTEPKLRLLVEGPDRARVEAGLQRLRESLAAESE